MSRTRTKDDGGSGTAQWGPIFQTRGYLDRRDTCVDEVAVGDGHPLSITHSYNKDAGHLVYGSRYQYPHTWTYVGFPMLWFASVVNGQFNHLGVAGEPSDAAVATSILSQTNPSRSYVDLPVFVAELRELPDLVRRFHGSVIRRAADANLRYQFGLRPLIGDVNKLLDFTGQVSQRVKELEALQKSGLRRTRVIWRGAAVEDAAPVQTNSDLGLKTWHRRHTTTRKTVWAHVKWFPTGSFPQTPPEMRALARRAVLGLTIDPVTAWELIPFSWLADWFGNVGDYLVANRNLVPCSHSVPQIMRQTETEHLFTLTSSNVIGVPTSHVVGKVTKSRTSSNAGLDVQLPFLSNRQMGILASLVALRGR